MRLWHTFRYKESVIHFEINNKTKIRNYEY